MSGGFRRAAASRRTQHRWLSAFDGTVNLSYFKTSLRVTLHYQMTTGQMLGICIKNESTHKLCSFRKLPMNCCSRNGIIWHFTSRNRLAFLQQNISLNCEPFGQRAKKWSVSRFTLLLRESISRKTTVSGHPGYEDNHLLIENCFCCLQ